MQNQFLYFLFLIFYTSISAQDYHITEKFLMPTAIEETSGLVFYDNRLITHNDSGNLPNLYEIDSISGNITRTVSISNATNVDWEDIAQDEDYLYIGDIGNNNGTRTDLKIYRILKTDYENSNSVVADIINYSYADQDDFANNPQNTNWDAESLVVWQDKLFIFSKNWVDKKVNLYVIPKIPGTYSASIESNYNLQGLLTGATLSADNVLFLLGYTTTLIPFFVVINEIDLSTNYNLFENSNLLKYTNMLSFGNQTEGICFVNRSSTEHHLFISCEEKTIAGTTYPAKLRTLDFKSDVIGLGVTSKKDEHFSVYPNPFTNRLSFNKTVDKIRLYNSLGSLILNIKNSNYINTQALPKGMYLLEIIVDQKKQTLKVVKK